jgi:hypothetical protein
MMTPQNKFEASKEFGDGYKFAVCRGSDAPRWDSELFMAGFEYGKTVKEEYYLAMNAELVRRGFQAIGKITTASG